MTKNAFAEHDAFWKKPKAETSEPTERPQRTRTRKRDGLPISFDEQIKPCGKIGLLVPTYSNAMFRYKERVCWQRSGIEPDLADCLVSRPRPWLLTIWEPLLTKAPGPHLASAYCCYIQTVIFYCRPYIVRPWSKPYRSNGGWSISKAPGGFMEWDKVDTRLTFDDIVEFEGERFNVGGGSVRWASHDGAAKRWWMCRSARRVDPERRA